MFTHLTEQQNWTVLQEINTSLNFEKIYPLSNKHLKSETYKSSMLSSKSSCTLLSPWLPNNKAQKVQNKHRCFCKGAEEWFVVLSKNILQKKKVKL